MEEEVKVMFRTVGYRKSEEEFESLQSAEEQKRLWEKNGYKDVKIFRVEVTTEVEAL